MPPVVFSLFSAGMKAPGVFHLYHVYDEKSLAWPRPFLQARRFRVKAAWRPLKDPPSSFRRAITASGGASFRFYRLLPAYAVFCGRPLSRPWPRGCVPVPSSVFPPGAFASAALLPFSLRKSFSHKIKSRLFPCLHTALPQPIFPFSSNTVRAPPRGAGTALLQAETAIPTGPFLSSPAAQELLKAGGAGSPKAALFKAAHWPSASQPPAGPLRPGVVKPIFQEGPRPLEANAFFPQ